MCAWPTTTVISTSPCRWRWATYPICVTDWGGAAARPKTYEFTPVTLADDQDFNKKSVRGTIVLRWEYVRGSTLFAVWNLSTSDEDARKGIYAPWRDLRGAFGAPGTNTFGIKLSYWFAP